MAVERGCGFREEGAVYIETPLSPHGKPVEHFLIDSPRIVDPSAAGLTPRGVQVVEMNGVFNVIDWIGANHYPNVADFVEEVRHHGLSRRIAPNVPNLHMLTSMSRIILLHARAHIVNAHEYYPSEQAMRDPVIQPFECPKSNPDHPPSNLSTTMCARLWWQDIELGEGVDINEPRLVEREMPSFSYYVRVSPPNVTPEYRPAFFAAFPIGQIAVIRAADGSHENTVARMQEMTSLPISIEEA